MLIPCGECKQNISDKASACPHCGHPTQPGNTPPPVVQQVSVSVPNSSNPAVAVLLSIFIPGLGQLYKGQPANGIVWFLVVVMCYVANIAVGFIVHLACIIGAGTRSKAAKSETVVSMSSGSPSQPTPSNTGGSGGKVFAVIAVIVVLGMALNRIEEITDDGADATATESSAIVERTTDYWITANRLSRRSCPSTDCGVLGAFRFREQAAVHEQKNGWARVSQYYDANCVAGKSKRIESGSAECAASNGIETGKVAEWVSMKYLAEIRPAPPSTAAGGASEGTTLVRTATSSSGRTYTPIQLNRMVSAGQYPDQGSVTTDSVSMSFAECLVKTNAIMSAVEENYPVKTIVDTSILYIVKAWTNDGVISTTCSQPDNKMVVTQAAYI